VYIYHEARQRMHSNDMNSLGIDEF